jgi:hypothetical protein
MRINERNLEQGEETVFKNEKKLRKFSMILQIKIVNFI